MGIGPIDAIIESTHSINGVPIKLIGTRIYMPSTIFLGMRSLARRRLLNPAARRFRSFGLIPKLGMTLHIAILLLPDDEDEYIELVLPNEVLNDEMTNHQEWFSRVAGTWLMSHSYDHGEDFIRFCDPWTRLLSGFWHSCRNNN